jgi:hypothetical protein
MFDSSDLAVSSVLGAQIYCFNWREPDVPHHGINFGPPNFSHDLPNARSIAQQFLRSANAGRVPTNFVGEAVSQSSLFCKLLEDSADLSAVESVVHAGSLYASQKVVVAEFCRFEPILDGSTALSAQTNRYTEPCLFSLGSDLLPRTGHIRLRKSGWVEIGK